MACEGCKLGFVKALLMFQNRQKSLDFLESHGIRDLQVKCPECDEFATLSEDNLQWYCQSGHSFERLVSADDWLESIQISPGKRCMFMAIYLQTNPPHKGMLIEELNVSERLVDDWCGFIREVLQDWCLQNSSKKVGGPTLVIEMDEAVIDRNKYGGHTIDGRWVFTGFEKNNTSNFFFEVVSERTSTTLMETITKRVRRGSKLLLDARMACQCLQKKDFENLKVNYAISFIDSYSSYYSQIKLGAISENDPPRFYTSCVAADLLFRKYYSDHRDRVHQFLMAVRTFPLGNRTLNDDDNDDDDTQMASVVFFFTCCVYALIASYFFYNLLAKYNIYPFSI